MDSSVSETYGQQQGAAYNGHFGCTCYHPLFVFNQFGDLRWVMLRRGNQHCAKFWRRVQLPFATGLPSTVTANRPSSVISTVDIAPAAPVAASVMETGDDDRAA